MKGFRRELSLKILRNFVTTLIISFALTALFLLAGLWIVRQRTWYGNENLFPLYNIVSNNQILIIIIIFLIEFISIFIYYWNRVLSYLEELISATEEIYSKKEELINLSPELLEVENNLNDIKLNLEKNERIARESERKKNDLIVYLAHDLKTPLTSIIGYLSLLRDEREISADLQEKYLGIALNKAERLEGLINEFFEITRFNLSNLSLELSKVNLRLMLEQIIFEFKPMLLEKNLDINLSIEGDFFVRLDINKIQRVFDNLLRNAINYSFKDGVIDIIVKKEEKLTIRFINNGDTIPKEKLDRLFEQFFRLDSSRATTSGGSGLGLSIAKEIVKLHNGELTAKSFDEKIEFKIELPFL